VTNGQIFLDGLSSKLACIGVPLHGKEATHDYLANKPGSYKIALSAIREYVRRGFDVRCIPVLTAQNHGEMYDVIRVAKKSGMESVFVDRFEDGGLGNRNSETLKPTSEQFGIALQQMIQARDDFGMPVGWGTAIPFCLDQRMVQSNMTCNCGAGSTFAAINPKGDLRVCNQSERIYGNVLEESIQDIWHKPEMEEFRGLSWISPACRDCAALAACTGGCKVDTNHSDMFCTDYSVRGKEEAILNLPPAPEPEVVVPVEMRAFRPSRYLRLSVAHPEPYVITRYQTVAVDDTAVRMVRQILDGAAREEELVALNQDDVEAEDIRRFVSQLILIDALEVVR
jgi:radical SAM protein with 4Fe4S-binding SPASM domain